MLERSGLESVAGPGVCTVPAGNAGRPSTGATTSRVRFTEGFMSVYKVIDIIGTSTTSWEDAAVTAVKTAGATVRDLRVAQVVQQDLDLGEGGAVTFRVKLQISFKYEE